MSVIIKSGDSTSTAHVEADGSILVKVTGSANPTGGATEAKQDLANTKLDTIANKLDTLTIEVNTDNTVIEGKLDTLHADNIVIEGKLNTVNTNLTTIDTDLNAKLAITNTELGGLTEIAPLTDTASSGVNGRLQRVAQRLTTLDADLNAGIATLHTDLLVVEGKQDVGNASLASVDTKLTSQSTAAKQDILAGKVDTVNTNLTTIDTDVKANTSTLHADNLATQTKLDTIDTDIKASQPRKLQDGVGNAITSTLISGKQAVDVNIAGGVTIDVQLQQANDSVQIYGNDGTTNRAILTDSTGKPQVVVTAIPLPPNASTSTNQATTNASLASVDTKLTSQATAANQTSMLTKLDTLHTDLLAVEGKQDTGNISLGSIDTKLTSQATAANQATEITKLTSLDTKLPAQGPALRTGATPVTMASDQPAINVGGTAPTGTAPAANPISVSGIDGGGLKRHLLTDTAGRLEIDTILSLPLPAGASTLAAQTQLDTDLNAFKAANHTDLLAVQTKQDTGNASFASIDTKLSSQATAANQTTMSTKLDTLHADNLVVEGKQDTGNISLSSIDTKLTSQATAANQVTEITKLTSLDNKTPALVSGRQPVDGSGVVQPISANDIITTGSITAVAQTVVLSTAGQSSGSFQISGTWVGTLLFEGSLDGVIWNAINAVSSSTSSPQPTTSVNGLYRLTPGALQQIRVNAISFTSGTVNVIGRSSLATGGIFANQIIPIIASALPLPAGAATSAAQTTQQSSLSSIDAKLTNGNQSARSLDGAGNAITSTTIGAKQRLDVTLAAGATVGTAVGIYTDIVGGKDIAGNAQMIATDTSGNQTAVGNVAAGTTDSGNPVKVGGKYNATAPTLVDGQRGDIQLTPNSRVIMVAEDGAKSTYSTAIQGLAASTAATDIFTITGSATKTVRIIKVGFSGIQTSGTIQDVLLIKRSAANTGGISSTPTIVPYDSNSAVATAVVRAYTVNPAMLGTAIGTVKAAKVLVNQSSGGPSGPTSPPDVIWVFGQGPTQALVLRGVAQQLVINYNGQTSAGSSLDMFIEWTEE